MLKAVSLEIAFLAGSHRAAPFPTPRDIRDVSAISRTEIASSFVIKEEAMARRGMQVSRECSLFRDATSRAVAPSTSIVAIVALVSAFCAPPLRSVRASEFLGLWARAAKTLCVLCP